MNDNMLTNLLIQLENIFVLMRENALTALLIVAVLWLIQLINKLLGYRLNLLGIYPRRIVGLPGIVCSLFLHSGFDHLFFNSIALFVFADFILIDGTGIFIEATIFITLLSGLLLWLFGRPAIHIGASGVIMGYLGYLLMDAYHQPSVKTVIIAIVCLYYFGGLLLSVFPVKEKMSWEGHVFGLISGVLAAIFLK